MKTKELADELMIWLPKLLAGETLEWIDVHGETGAVPSITHLIESLEEGDEIRIKQTPFPDAPDGCEWHNPDNLTPEQVGIDDGWRLLLVSEACKAEITYRPCQYWSINLDWEDGGSGLMDNLTYRVKTAEHPVGSLKPKPKAETIECSEYWLDLDGAHYFLVHHPAYNYTRAIVPLPYAVVEKALKSNMHQILPRKVMETLLGLNMIANDPLRDHMQKIDDAIVSDEPNPFDENHHKKKLDSIYNGFKRLGYTDNESRALASAIMDGRVSEFITVGPERSKDLHKISEAKTI